MSIKQDHIVSAPRVLLGILLSALCGSVVFALACKSPDSVPLVEYTAVNSREVRDPKDEYAYIVGSQLATLEELYRVNKHTYFSCDGAECLKVLSELNTGLLKKALRDGILFQARASADGEKFTCWATNPKGKRGKIYKREVINSSPWEFEVSESRGPGRWPPD